LHRLPSICRFYFKRNLSARNLHRKIEYTATIAPAQLGKAIVSR
jgi:hypothetical protein